jgi:hypothetical protein
MTWLVTMIDNPWRDILPSPKADLLSARRVDASLPFGFFWAKGADSRYLLLLQHQLQSSQGLRLPKIKGIEVTVSQDGDNGTAVLVLRLLDSAQRDLFYRLCLDIVDAGRGAASEKDAVAATVSRTWRWHHLLRGGGDERLSPEEQKGLIGELLVLRRLVMILSPHDAVSAWRGPLGSPKDFEIGRISIEAKARRGAAAPYVAISSEHQLDTSGVDVLLLCVHELDQAPADNGDAMTLSETARALHDLIAEADPGAAAHFESLLLSAGFRWDHDYSDAKWLRGQELVYRVATGFPSVTAAGIPAGVMNVRYSLSLPACEPFLLASETIDSLLAGEGYAQ